MGSVDYRLARRAALLGVRTGFVSRADLCDAHPELVRAARHIGEPTKAECPMCDASDMRLLLYTYGRELKRENGRVRRVTDLPALQDRFAEFQCYLIEVCVNCSWNHLVRSFQAGHRHRAKGVMPVTRRRQARS
jgi:hypothetical protein